MIPLQKPLTEAERQFLEGQLQLKPKEIKPLPEAFNPHSRTYWRTNALLLAAAVIGRWTAAKGRGPTVFWSTAIVAIPAFTLFTTSRLDSPTTGLGHRKTIEERLDLSPVTRRAWERALKSNDEYQAGLRREIAELKAKQSNSSDSQ